MTKVSSAPPNGAPPQQQVQAQQQPAVATLTPARPTDNKVAVDTINRACADRVKELAENGCFDAVKELANAAILVRACIE